MNRLIIDIPSISKACLYAGVDGEFGRKVTFEGKEFQVNSPQWGYENFMVSYRSVLDRFGLRPYQTVAVLDGKHGNMFRRNIFSGYKGKREKKPPEIYQAYNDMAEGIADEISSLGGLVCWQAGMEGDDVVAYLAKTLGGRKLVWARDGDLIALKDETVDVLYDTVLNPATYKTCPDTKWITLYKALCGDTSDNFPGAKGFGPKAFQKVAMTLGADGLADLERLIQKRQLNMIDLDACPDLKKVVEQAADVYTSYACAKFYPELVNTSASPLKIVAQVTRELGEDTHELMKQWAGTKKLAKLSDKAWIMSEIAKSPLVSLDIETDTPPESKAWVERILANSDKRSMVDIMGSYLVGMSLTFGDNLQHTVYVPVRHARPQGSLYDTPNWDSGEAADLVGAIPDKLEVAIHNTAFELPVLYNEWGGWVEGAIDTALMSSYVDENEKMGLKDNSLRLFDYKQTSYEEVTTKEGPLGTLPAGGKQTKTFQKEITPAVTQTLVNEDTNEVRTVVTPAVTEPWEAKQYGMAELTAAEVFEYGCDDTRCTAALYNRLRFTMELEGCWQTFLDVEVPVTYVMAQAYVDGIDVDFEKLSRLEVADKEEADRLWYDTVRPYLMKKGWAGCEPPTFERTPAGIKQAFEIIMGNSLDCRARMEDKIIAAVREQGCPELADALESDSDIDSLIQEHFVAEPDFSVSKSKDLVYLMYEVMGLPIRFRTVPTENMRARGIREGNPQADASAIEHALQLDLEGHPEEAEILKAVRDIKGVETRNNLYYRPYPLYKHWKTGKIHSNPGQCRTTTRRAASSNPNLTQISKYKDMGRMRSTLVAPEGFIMCAADQSSQELRHIAEASQDQALLSCYIGDDLRDPHHLTGLGIAIRRGLTDISTYETFAAAIEAGDKSAKKCRNLAKVLNFGTAYGTQAKKLAKMLVCSVEDATVYLAEKNRIYSGITQWQQEVPKLARAQGYVATPLGVRRHLYEKLNGHDKWAGLEAERQAINFIIQSGSAEQIKLVLGEMYLSGIMEEYGIRVLATIHDEIVVLIPVNDRMSEAVIAFHRCMVRQYADMKVPAMSDVSIGWNFGELQGIGKHPTHENIQAAYKKLLTT